MALRILIADSTPATREQLRADIANAGDIEIAGLARDGQEALQLVHKLRPDIALIAADLAVYDGFQTVEFLTAAESTVCVLMSHIDTPDMLRRAMRAGAREFMVYPATRERVLQTLQDVYAEMQHRQSPTFAEAADPEKSARIIAVGGAKGGIGKTTITTNLAVSLAQETGEPTVLFDLYTQFGDIALLLNMKPRRTLMDLRDMAPDAIDSQILNDCMGQHESGLNVLVTSQTPVALDALSLPFLDRTIRLLKDKYRYILIDVPPILHAGTLHTFSYATSVLLIANRNEITTINNTRQLLQTLRGKYVAEENIYIVLNRLAANDPMEIADIERALDCPVAAHIPNDGTVVSDSINTGVPFVFSHPESFVAHSICDLAHRLGGTMEPMKHPPASESPVRKWNKWNNLFGGLLDRGRKQIRRKAA